jgi:hypothetical protein
VNTVFILPFGADTGGVNHQIVDAFRTEPGWLVRAMISGRNYIEYPSDLIFDYRMLGEWWRAADVIHLSHEFYRLRKVERLKLPARPKVMHYHGTGYRERAEDLIRHQRANRAIGLVATLDLWLLNPDETEWLPCPYNLNALQSHVAASRSPGMVKVAHAPTARKIKSTEPFLRAVKRLQEEGYELELDLIEKVSWKECLQRKASADIYFDQTILGYGNNAIEAWGMGIPVIAGASERTLQEMRRRLSNTLPFYQTTEGTIYEALKAMVQSPDLRAEYAERGLWHVQRFHDQKVVVEQLKDVYQRAIDGRH